jgi:DNA-directed RNA polymerase specialized sigma subunit
MTHEKASQIRELYFSRQATQKQLATQFKISQSAVCRIVSGWTWNA